MRVKSQLMVMAAQRQHSGSKASGSRRGVNEDLSSGLMQASPLDLAQVRLDNALALFEEFVRATARHADAATLRGLERRFAERVQIQPSYWSQIKGRSRQIGERLARQFELLCHKPAGWMDTPHGVASAPRGALALSADLAETAGRDTREDLSPRDDDERFIMGLVLTFYRRHPQRARTRLLDLLGEVLTAPAATAPPPPAAALTPPKLAPGVVRKPPAPPAPPAPPEDPRDLWLRTQTGVAPLKRKR